MGTINKHKSGDKKMILSDGPIKRLLRLLAALIIASIVLVFFTTGCGQSAPIRQQGEIDACYMFRECMYRNEKNPDKTACKDFGSECRAYGRFNYCKDEKNRPDDCKFQECWDKLNSK